MRFLFILMLCFTPLTHAEGLLDRLPGLGGAQPAFLPPDQAFGLDVNVSDARTLLANPGRWRFGRSAQRENLAEMLGVVHFHQHAGAR